ncbi:MAG: type III secretion system outer membrane ring subunit SctC [Reinekea sp.]
MKYFKPIALSLWLFCAVAGAAEPKWDKSPYELYANSEALAGVLRNFSASYGIPVTVSAGINGSVNGRFKGETPKDFLEVLGESFDFEWYYDGTTLHFFRGDEIVNRIITLTNVKPSQLRASIKEVGIWDDRFSWKEVPDKGLVYVSGPTSMVNLIQETALVLESQVVTMPKQEQYSLRMFPLRYATATDQTQTFRGKNIVIPGMASILRNTLGRGQGGGNAASGGPTGVLEAKVSDGLVRQAPVAGEKAWIQADSRTNSIIIYDRVDRMVVYQTLIHNLDQPSEQIEVNVSVITVSTNELSQLGISWQGRDSNYGEVGYNGLNGQNATPGIGQISLLSSAGNTFSTVLDSGADYFLTKVDALAQDGNAQFISRPSIVTSEHMEAVLDDTTTFHVRVAGNQQVDLFPVNVGSVLRVTPHIQRGDLHQAISLEVTIEDGQQTGDQVDGIPVIKTSTINTQTSVEMGQSLLIGGFYQNFESSDSIGIPVLKDIPVFGALFRSKSHGHHNVVKLFLLTPKVITGQRTEDGKKIVAYSFQVGTKNKDTVRAIREYYDQRGFETRASVDKKEGKTIYSVYIGNYARCEDTEKVARLFPAAFSKKANMINSCSPISD